MAGSLALVSARHELLQCLPCIGQVLSWELLSASETPPQPDETFRVTGKPHRAAGMRELGLEISIFPVWNRGGVGTLRQAHGTGADVASRAVRVPVGSGLQGCLGTGARARRQRPHIKVFAC